MNCLSEFGTRQAVVHQDIQTQANHQHCFARQPSSSVRRASQALRRSPLLASKAHQQHQARSKQRKLVRCQSSQLAGPGQWGQAADHNVVLVADIGGTNCRFVLWRLDLQTGNHEKLFSKIYPTKDYMTFDDALDALGSEDAFKIDTPGAAAFACAGPVLDNKCVMTNLEWIIDGQSLTVKYGIRMAVLNDFEACGYGVPALQPEDLLVLNDVPARQKGPKACMGPGTGLGQANLYWSENFGDYRVWPSEGAHASFAPRGWKQRALQTHVERQLGYCEVEHVCCGSGLQRIYEFLQTDEHCARPDLDLTMIKTAAEISKAAMDNSDQLAVEAVDLFLALIGAEAGHMGLRSLASGGIYICGGIMPKLIEKIMLGGVLDSYLHEKSRFNKLLKTFPLYVVLNEGLGLLGTREYAIRLLQTPEVCK